MNENIAEEKLRIFDTLKENASLVLVIVGVIWAVVQTIIFPLNSLEFNINDILGNHLKTIEDEQIRATLERKEQMGIIMSNSERLIRIETTLEQILNKK